MESLVRVSIIVLLLLLANNAVALSKSVDYSIHNVLNNAKVTIAETNLPKTANINKGEFAENLSHTYLNKTLSGQGNWDKVSLSNRRQGLDGVMIKFDKNNNPRKLLITEVKFNSSQLGNTKNCGKQMSPEWIRCGLDYEAKRYSGISKTTEYRPLPRKRAKIDRIEVRLKNGEVGTF